MVGVISADAPTVAPTDEVADMASTGTVIPDTSEYSDLSSICDSFKQVKRIDELDFTPQPLPISKSKLKRLKNITVFLNWGRAAMYPVPMIKLATWNIRGMNDSLKQKELSTLVRARSLSVVCILETRVRIHNRVRIFNSILPGWEMHHNYEHAALGRIWVCWNPRVVKMVDICVMIKLFCVT